MFRKAHRPKTWRSIFFICFSATLQFLDFSHWKVFKLLLLLLLFLLRDSVNEECSQLWVSLPRRGVLGSSVFTLQVIIMGSVVLYKIQNTLKVEWKWKHKFDIFFIIKFLYNVRYDWLRKQRVFSQNSARVDDIKLVFKFLLRNRPT